MTDDRWPSSHEVTLNVVDEATARIEFAVPLGLYTDPEAAMFKAVAQYLDQLGYRVLVFAFNCCYTQSPAPFLIATLVTSTAIDDGR